MGFIETSVSSLDTAPAVPVFSRTFRTARGDRAGWPVLAPGDGPAHGVVAGWLLPQKGASQDALTGRVLDGKYVLGPIIGQGAIGRVYRARQVSLEREVAIKILNPGYANHPEAIARFRLEARAASRISHPGIVTILDWGKDPDGLLYLVIEYLPGRDLFDIAQSEAPLDSARIARLDAASRGRSRSRARRGSHPPRSQTREPAGPRRSAGARRAPRDREDLRFRRGPRDAGAHPGVHQGRGDGRHALLHEPRTGRVIRGVPAERPLLVRRHHVPAGYRHAALRRAVASRRRHYARQEAAADARRRSTRASIRVSRRSFSAASPKTRGTGPRRAPSWPACSTRSPTRTIGRPDRSSRRRPRSCRPNVDCAGRWRGPSARPRR